ncbi:hypothetical protein CFC21_025486 [Triticum aestivum]|uniref:BED-type domain-containing protein n=2 Tax=Triticum aestivum TaxID=4565 RepID=A0A9R1EJZ8_WHEAT|nr:hypothetical protein CFC21_025486 [Triticum aestivum]
MEAAIAWLVQTILATLLIDKLDAWIRQVGLADDVEKLKSEIRRVKMVVSAVKERGIRNESLDESLALLVERLYEADDVVDELDYYRLQELVEGARPRLPADPTVLVPSNLPIQGEGATRNEPEGNSAGKSRSVVWENFTVTETVDRKSAKAVCRHCGNEFKCDTKINGTSSMKKHLEKEHPDKMKPPGAHPPNPSSTAEPIAIASSSRGKGKKQRSKAWDNFDVIENDIGQPTKAICKYCHTEIKCGMKTGTAGMLNHNKICKKKPEPNDQPPNLSSYKKKKESG